MNTFQRVRPEIFAVEKVNIPPVTETRLKNNVPVFMIEAGTEEIMRMEILFRAGQVREKIPLVSSTTNLMLLEGSENYTAEEISRELDFYGTYINLMPEKDLSGIVIFFLNKHIEKVLELISEIIFHPAFPETELRSLMNKRARWFLVNREKTATLAMDRYFEAVFGKSHPYGRQITEKDFKMLNPDLVRDFHSSYYTPGNMAVIITGMIHKQTMPLLDKYLGESRHGGTQEKDIQFRIRGDKTKEIHLNKQDAVQTAIRIGAATINKRSTDYPGLKVVNTILGGYFGSRLMKNIREEKGYTYGISSGVSSLDLSGYHVISSEVNPKNADDTVREILNEIRRLQTIPVSEDELEVVRNYMSGEMVRMFDGPFAIAESFRAVWEFGLDTGYFLRLSEKILNIRADEIIELAETYYNIDDLYKVTVGPE